MKLKIFLVSMFFLGFFLAPAPVDAAVPLFKDICGHNSWESGICDDASQGSDANPLYGPGGIISTVVNLLSIMVGIAAVIGIIVAGIKYLTSASNPEEANKSRELVIYAVVGLMLATVAQVMVRTVLHNIGV
jgi:hypothetical protein